jgi:hypothetical protein
VYYQQVEAVLDKEERQCDDIWNGNVLLLVVVLTTHVTSVVAAISDPVAMGLSKVKNWIRGPLCMTCMVEL